jgi:GntR family transcriptional regulator
VHGGALDHPSAGARAYSWWVPAELLDDPPRLERRRGVPVHAQIERWLTDVIARGDLVAGQRLPGERHLAAALRVSRMTLRQALDGLGRRGVLVRLPGRSGGAFVAEPKIDYDLTGSAGFSEQMRRAGRRADATVLVARTTAAEQPVAAALWIAAGEPVHELVRVRSADGVALVVTRSWLPAARLPGLLDLPLTGSLRALLGERFGLAPQSAVEHLEPATADPDDAAALDVPTGTPLMAVERTAFSAEGAPVELARDRYRADRVRLVVRTGAGLGGALTGPDPAPAVPA